MRRRRWKKPRLKQKRNNIPCHCEPRDDTKYMANLSDLKKLREQTGAGIMECRQALEESSGNLDKAKKILKSKGIEKAAKKVDRETKQGLVSSYIHNNGMVGSMVELLCETDFVARTDDFKNLSHELCMQVASMNPKNVAELEKQEYIRDNSLKVSDFLKQTIAKLGENIKINRFQRFAINE